MVGGRAPACGGFAAHTRGASRAYSVCARRAAVGGRHWVFGLSRLRVGCHVPAVYALVPYALVRTAPEREGMILRQACAQGYPDAPFAFKDLMIHGILQVTLRIAVRCVLHRCENQEIRC